MSDDSSKLALLAKVARSNRSAVAGKSNLSVLALVASSYGARPDRDSTVPTGFDPLAISLFEAIVEASYLVAAADGAVDAAERAAFERVVVEACGGVVAESQVAALVADLADLLEEDGMDRRIAEVGTLAVRRPEVALEVIRIAALIAQASGGVADTERNVLEKLSVACGLTSEAVDAALNDVAAALATD